MLRHLVGDLVQAGRAPEGKATQLVVQLGSREWGAACAAWVSTLGAGGSQEDCEAAFEGSDLSHPRRQVADLGVSPHEGVCFGAARDRVFFPSR